eukprot:scaffold7355_cov246-Pinguiococcus_pyrenoidosus.AAC.1
MASESYAMKSGSSEASIGHHVEPGGLQGRVSARGLVLVADSGVHNHTWSGHLPGLDLDVDVGEKRDHERGAPPVARHLPRVRGNDRAHAVLDLLANAVGEQIPIEVEDDRARLDVLRAERLLLLRRHGSFGVLDGSHEVAPDLGAAITNDLKLVPEPAAAQPLEHYAAAGESRNEVQRLASGVLAFESQQSADGCFVEVPQCGFDRLDPSANGHLLNLHAVAVSAASDAIVESFGCHRIQAPCRGRRVGGRRNQAGRSEIIADQIRVQA